MSNTDVSKNAVYAILADSVYWDVRKRFTTNIEGSNWTPVPSDWKLIAEMSGSGDVGRALNKDLEGFTARAYQNGNKIVIVYAGTHQPDFSGDWKNNAKLGAGVASEQAKLAAIFYQQIKQSNTLADIEFTGHSLGGGLAGMMGVWFNRPAYIFDHAPFVNAVIKEGDTKPSYREDPTVGDWLWDSLPEAIRSILSDEPEQLITSSTMKYARQALMEKFGYIDNEFARYSAKDHLEQRTKNITAIATKGEFLDFVSFAGMHYKENEHILDGETSYPWTTAFGAAPKHSQTLLVSALLDKNFEHYATVKKDKESGEINGANIDTLPMILDSNLYFYEQGTSNQNFLSKLVRSHIGTTMGGGIDYATGDVVKKDDTTPKGSPVKYQGKSLLSAFGYTLKILAENLQPYNMNSKYHKLGYDVLVANAIEWYYHQDIATYNGDYFISPHSNTLQFTTAQADELTDKYNDQIKDYAQKWVTQAYLNVANLIKNAEDITQYDQWTVALNGGSANALDNTKTQILITFGNGATFTAGDKDDLLFGYDGDDTLTGGKGEDIIYGGKGEDKLYGGDSDHKDTLIGGADADILYGGDGDDTLIGGISEKRLRDDDAQNELYGEAGNDTLKGSGRLEGGKDYDKYYAYDTATVKDEDGKGELYYHDQRLVGAHMHVRVKSKASLVPPSKLDFSKDGYDILDKSTGRLEEIRRTKTSVTYLVKGDNNFVYKNKLTTENLMGL